MSFESMFRLSIRFINETASVNRDDLICKYMDRVNSEMHVSYEVMKKLLRAMNVKFPDKYKCTICNVDIVEIPVYAKCEKCKEYTHTICMGRNNCGNYCSTITPKPKLII